MQDQIIEFKIPETFKENVDGAIVRMNYLAPSIEFEYKEGSVFCISTNEQIMDRDAIKRDFFHQLYRDKIHRETLPIRKWLMSDEN